MFNFLIHNKGILHLIKTSPNKTFWAKMVSYLKKNQVFGS